MRLRQDTATDALEQTQASPSGGETPRNAWAFGAAVCLSALGVLLISVAYAFGRERYSGGTLLFWVGQVLTFAPLGAYLLRRRGDVDSTSASLIVGLLAGETYLIKWMYSPTQLKFIDELMSVRGTLNVLATGRVGVTNYSLLISKDFPGLQSVSGTFAAMTGLSQNAVGLILGGLFHISIVIMAYIFFRAIFRSRRSGALAVLIYSTNSSFETFNSYFVYENLALPFMFGTLFFIWKLRTTDAHRTSFAAAAYVCFMATVASHHITSFYLCGFLLIILFELAITRSVKAHRLLMAVIAVSLLSAGIWFAAFSKDIGNYIQPYTTGVLNPGTKPELGLLTSSHLSGVPTPVFDKYVTYAAFGALTVALLFGMWRAVRRERHIWLIPFAVIAVIFLLSLPAGRLLPFGGQIYGRLASYVYVGVAFFITVLVTSRIGTIKLPRLRPTLIVGGLTLLFVGGLAVAVPPYWERLPGRFYPKGYESGLDARTVRAATWSRANLGEQKTFATDANGNATLSTLGNEIEVFNGNALLYLKSLDPEGYKIIRNYRLRYAWVDTRLATIPSPTARYFYGASNGYYQIPPTTTELAKFNDDPRVSCIYDDGKIRIYDMTIVFK